MIARKSSQDGFNIEREEQANKGRYVIRLDGVEAEMTYWRSGDHTITINRTTVPNALRGRGVGEALVRRGVEDARTEGRSVIPLCPFANAQINRHPEWNGAP